jgi:flavodoxin
MAKIGLFYGTQTGNTQNAAEFIQKEFGGDSVVDLYDIPRSLNGSIVRPKMSQCLWRSPWYCYMTI